MKLWAAVVLGFAIGSFQLRFPAPHVGKDIQISELFANYTLPATTFDTAKDLAAVAGDGTLPPTAKDLAAVAGDGTPPPIPPRPAPRPPRGAPLELYSSASDDVWEKAKCKGTNFMRAMRGSDREAGSMFRPPRASAAGAFATITEGDIIKWGWDFSTHRLNGDFEEWGVDGALRDLGLDDKCLDQGGSMVCILYTHGELYEDKGNWINIDQQTYNVDGRTYRKTGAHYGLAIDPQKGVIIAMDRNSPQSAGKERNPVIKDDDLPALRPFSDIAWFSWKTLAVDIKNLNYFWSLSINNEETLSILSRAIRESVPGAQGFPVWQGYEFSTDTPEGQAILGTPNAQAFGYLLLQNKATLGNLYISRVRVFRDSREPEPGPCMLLIVEPVPANSNVGEPGEQQNVKRVKRGRRDVRRLKLRANL